MVSYEEVFEYMSKNNTSIRKTAEHFSITKTIPEKVSKDLNRRKEKIHSNNDSFKTLNKESLYWLGFLYADGYIEKRSDNNIRIELCLQILDVEHLEKFKSFIKYKGDVKVRKDYKSARILICNSEIGRTLIDLGCVPNKSLILKIPKEIKEHKMFKHFIRGYIDGDGCYIKHKESFKGISILGTEDVLDSIQEYFIENNFYENKKNIRNAGNIYDLRIYKKDSIKIINHIYEDSTYETRLNRKFDYVSKIDK